MKRHAQPSRTESGMLLSPRVCRSPGAERGGAGWRSISTPARIARIGWAATVVGLGFLATTLVALPGCQTNWLKPLGDGRSHRQTCGPTWAREAEMQNFGPPALAPQSISLQPGQAQRFSVTRWADWYLTVPADDLGCVAWTLDPPSAGSIDERGLLQLAADAAAGQQVTIRAVYPDAVAIDKRYLSASVTVYTLDSNPLVGTWRERSAFDCAGGATATYSFEELTFEANGYFSVAWRPFEAYKDYWGAFRYDAQTGELELRVAGGNYIPEQVTLHGTVVHEANGALRLDGVYFGAPSAGDRFVTNDAGATVPISELAPTCGYVIECAYPDCGRQTYVDEPQAPDW